MNKEIQKVAEEFISNKDSILKKEYDYEKDLNWKDTGDELTDPCKNDFLKGYNHNQYEFKQWAKKNNVNLKTAAYEQINMHFYPEFLSDYMLTMWHTAGGPLQNFFEGFTLRYDNELKMKLANILEKNGYKVYPVLTEDQPRYAKFKEILRKIIGRKNINNALVLCKTAFNSDKFKLCLGELDDLCESGNEIDGTEAIGLLNYYKQIYPKDFAINLVTNLVEDNDDKNINYPKFKDYNISDEALDKINDYMNGSADPMYTNDGGFNGWNFSNDSRGFDGTMPTQLEIRSKKKS